jgi:phage FluMu gp28-like protein
MTDLLLPYQQRWVADKSPIKVAEKSRRIGITWTEAADDVLTAAGRKGMDTWYVGYNKDMAREFIETVAEWARRFNQAFEQTSEVIDDENKDILAYRVQFASGHKVVALSSRPSNLRGKQGRAVIDEAAFHEDLPGLLKAAIAFTMWGGQVRIISTHNGADNAFNELVNDIRAGRRPYSLHRTTLDDALGEGLYRRICDVIGREWSLAAEQAWRDELFGFYGDNADEELLCIPRRDSGAYLPSSLIEARMNPDIPVLRWELETSFGNISEGARNLAAKDWCEEHLAPRLRRLEANSYSFFGEDFGRSGDLTVIWPLQLAAKMVRRTPFVIELRNVPFKQQEQILFYLVDRLPKFIAGSMDAGGNGQYLAEQAYYKYGSRVEQVKLSIDWYRENMPRYKAAFEDGMIELPSDPDILMDHRAITMENGVAKVSDVRATGRDGKQRHGDSAIAGALAYYASQKGGPGMYEFHSIHELEDQKHAGRSLSAYDRAPRDDDPMANFMRSGMTRWGKKGHGW